MLMRNQNSYEQLVIKHPEILFEDRNTSRVGLKTKTDSPRIICHECYVPDDPILLDCKHHIIDP